MTFPGDQPVRVWTITDHGGDTFLAEPAAYFQNNGPHGVGERGPGPPGPIGSILPAWASSTKGLKDRRPAFCVEG